MVELNLGNFITIGLIAFAGVWLLNRGLSKVGYPQYQA